ncbi:MAG: biopolymer transporter ExbD [Bacteroidia bacterium]|nr:biopolymer transporter ExbD [Bacteroidia bacterium]
MGLKKRSKVSAQFNMSSLTDIIFLLLIFFMLTSTLVAPNALNLKLPSSSKSNVVSSNDIDDVRVASNGSYYLNRRRVSKSQLAESLRGIPKNGSITISPDKRTPTEHVVYVMDLAMRYNINAILASEVN